MNPGMRLELIMREKGITAYKIEKCTGIATSTVNALRNGHSTGYAYTWKVIADFLDVSMGDIFDGTEF